MLKNNKISIDQFMLWKDSGCSTLSDILQVNGYPGTQSHQESEQTVRH